MVWLRNFNITEINFGSNDVYNLLSIQAWENVLPTFLSNLKCNWISSPQAFIQSSDRAKQLTMAKAVGFNIPNTLITNDPDALLDFYDVNGKNIIVKSVHNHSIEVKGKMYSMYTRTITEQEISKIGDLIYVPYIFQEKLSRKFELRITVVGDQVFSAKLGEDFILDGCDDDYHRYLSSDFPIQYIKMSDSFNERCIKLIKSLDLKYGAIDFMVDKNYSNSFSRN